MGFALAEAKQRFDHHTRHVHTSGRTWSNLEYKVGGGGQGAVVLHRADPDRRATRRAARPTRRTATCCSPSTAHADTIPELEILTDDVSCTHGATVAPVDDEQVFYLQSRGLPRTAAVRLIVRGFLESTLAQVPSPLREELEDAGGRRGSRESTEAA